MSSEPGDTGMAGPMKPLVIAIGALALIAPDSALGQAATQAYSANFMVPHCRRFIAQQDAAQPSTPDSVNALYQGMCTGIVSTVFYFAQLYPEQFRVCVPKGSNVGQVIRMVVKFADNHPEHLHEDFRLVAMVALQDGWPCKK